MRILFVASEGLPFSKTCGLADVLEALPKALAAQGHEVAGELPRYRGMEAAAVAIPGLTIPMAGGRVRFAATGDGQVGGVRCCCVGDVAQCERDGMFGCCGGGSS